LILLIILYKSLAFDDRLSTVFTRSFDMDVAMRIWDLYLLEGDVVLFKVALGEL
jgi:hypothetical protein